MADRDSCVFCKIVDGKDPKTEILYQDSEVVIFKDIRPATDHHYLVVTREHIANARLLTAAHKPLVEKMVDVSKQFLQDRGASTSESECRFGFHLPPFNQISHLHMHAISSTSQMSFLGRLIFRPGMWFIPAVQLLTRLK